MSRIFLLVPGVVILELIVMLVQLKMNWLDIRSMFFNLAGFTALALILSNKFIKRKSKPRSLLSFRAIVITVSLLFCTITSNVLLQLGQKQVSGHVHTVDASKEAYEEQHGKTDEIFGRQLTEGEAKAFTLVQRVSHTFIEVLSEEVVSRWIILGSLVLVLPPAWAVAVSSLIFAGTHLVYPIALSEPQVGLMRLLPTFAIGLFCGIAYLWYGLPSAVLIHFSVNLIRLFADDEYTFVVDWIFWGSALFALIILPPTLWFTWKCRKEPVLVSQAPIPEFPGSLRTGAIVHIERSSWRKALLKN